MLLLPLFILAYYVILLGIVLPVCFDARIDAGIGTGAWGGRRDGHLDEDVRRGAFRYYERAELLQRPPPVLEPGPPSKPGSSHDCAGVSSREEPATARLDLSAPHEEPVPLKVPGLPGTNSTPLVSSFALDSLPVLIGFVLLVALVSGAVLFHLPELDAGCVNVVRLVSFLLFPISLVFRKVAELRELADQTSAILDGWSQLRMDRTASRPTHRLSQTVVTAGARQTSLPHPPPSLKRNDEEDQPVESFEAITRALDDTPSSYATSTPDEFPMAQETSQTAPDGPSIDQDRQRDVVLHHSVDDDSEDWETDTDSSPAAASPEPDSPVTAQDLETNSVSLHPMDDSQELETHTDRHAYDMQMVLYGATLAPGLAFPAPNVAAMDQDVQIDDVSLIIMDDPSTVPDIGPVFALASSEPVSHAVLDSEDWENVTESSHGLTTPEPEPPATALDMETDDISLHFTNDPSTLPNNDPFSPPITSPGHSSLAQEADQTAADALAIDPVPQTEVASLHFMNDSSSLHGVEVSCPAVDSPELLEDQNLPTTTPPPPKSQEFPKVVCAPASFVSLPVELVSEIMVVAALSSSVPTTTPEYLSSVQYVLPLVARWVRKVAFATPALWTRVTLPLHASCAFDWFYRSGNLPLEILTLMGGIRVPDVMAIRSFMSSPELMARCRTLSIHACSDELFPTLYLPAPRLEVFEMHYHGPYHGRFGRSRDLTLFMSKTPSLHSVTLEGFPLPITPNLSSTLTSLDLSYFDGSYSPTKAEFLNMLRGAQSLRTLILKGLQFRVPGAGDRRILPISISLPSLEFAEFCGCTLDALMDLLPNIEVGPRMNTLLLRVERHVLNPLVARGFEIPQDPFFSNLRSLEIDGGRLLDNNEYEIISDLQIRDIVVQSPRLERLTLRHVYGLICSTLSYVPGSDLMPVPNLKYLHLDHCSQFSRSGLFSFVQRRMSNRNVALLEEVLVENCVTYEFDGPQTRTLEFNAHITIS